MRYRLANVHRYPTVEYIPLTPRIIKEAPVWTNLNYGNLSLIIQDGLNGWGPVADSLPRDFQVKLPPLQPDEAGLVTLNFTILEVMYRANTVLVTAEEKSDFTGVYIITKRFFYKPKLIFEVYNLKEKKLAWSNFLVHLSGRQT